MRSTQRRDELVVALDQSEMISGRTDVLWLHSGKPPRQLVSKNFVKDFRVGLQDFVRLPPVVLRTRWSRVRRGIKLVRIKFAPPPGAVAGYSYPADMFVDEAAESGQVYGHQLPRVGVELTAPARPVQSSRRGRK
jgi:hypothetical protein